MKILWDCFSGSYRIEGFEYLGSFRTKTEAKKHIKDRNLCAQ